MKTKTKDWIFAIIITAISATLILTSPEIMGQDKTTYSINKSGKITATKDSIKIKTADKVYQIIDGVTFYKGSNGGVYQWKVSKKTGKSYKSYLPKTK